MGAHIVTKENVCVFIKDEAQLEQARSVLDGHGEEIDDYMFRIPTFDGCNKLSKWRLDGKWRISNSDRNTITLSELEQILKSQNPKWVNDPGTIIGGGTISIE